MMKLSFKSIAVTFCLATSWAGSVAAAPIEMLFDFTGGFAATYNGGAVNTGQLTFSVLIDNTTADLDASANRGRFAVTSVSVTALDIGLAGELVVSPAPLFVDTFSGGMTIIGAGFDPDIGWNGGPAPSTFMTDINDLSTLPVPFSTTMVSTFFLDALTLQNGDTLGANLGGGGANGTFSVGPAISPVPLPASLPLIALGIGFLGFIGRKNRKMKLVN